MNTNIFSGVRGLLLTLVVMTGLLTLPATASATLLDTWQYTVDIPTIDLITENDLGTTAFETSAGGGAVSVSHAATQCKLTIDTAEVAYGDDIVLTWDVAGYDTVVVNGDTVSALTGTVTVENITEDSVFVLTATDGQGNTCTQSVSVNCIGDAPAPVVEEPTVVAGCTNQYADNYNQDATEDDHSCIFTPAPSAPVCALEARDGRTIVDFSGQKLRTDQTEVQSYTNDRAIALPAGEYAVTLMSWDGYKGRVTTSQPNEQWKLHFLNGVTVVAASGYSTDLADNVIEAQRIDQVNTNLDIPTAVTAVRGVQPYYPQTQYANSLYPICAAIDVIVDEPTPVLGCTDETATNYDAAATQDDNSCTYPVDPVRGCTDAAATNYDADATEDDGSCTLPTTTVSSSGGGGGSSSRPRCELEASDTTITAGETVTLTWETRSTREITLTDDRGNVLVTTDGRLSDDKGELLDSSIEVSPTRDTVYTLTAERGSRDRECDVTIEVESEPLVILEARDQAPLAAGISLSDVPYTGFEAGPVLTTLFYTLLAVWAIYLTFVLVVPKTVPAIAAPASTTTQADYNTAVANAEAVRATAFTPDAIAMPATATAVTGAAPANLPVAPAAPAPATMAASTTANVPVEVAALEAIAHNNQALLSSDAIKTFILNVPVEEQLTKVVEIVNDAKGQYPLEDGWVVINNDRMSALLVA